MQTVTLSLANLTHPTVLPAWRLKKEAESMIIALLSGVLHLTTNLTIEQYRIHSEDERALLARAFSILSAFRGLKFEAAVEHVDFDGFAGGEIAGQDFLGQWVLDFLLDSSFQGPGAVHRVETGLAKQTQRGI